MLSLRGLQCSVIMQPNFHLELFCLSETAVEKMTLSSRGALKAESGKAEFGGDFIVMNSTDGTV